MTVSQFTNWLTSTGWTSTVKGAATVWAKGNMSYTVYIDKTYGSWAAQYFVGGSKILKIRFGQ